MTLFDGAAHTAKLLGSDPNNDLTVSKIEVPDERLHSASWGNSDKLLVGVRVFALGNPFGMERMMTAGMVSSLDGELVQTVDELLHGGGGTQAW